MKQFILLLCVLVTVSAFGQMPRTLNYQGTLSDGSKAVPDGNYKITFRLYATSSGGTKVWDESQEVTTRSGVFNAILGKTSPLPESFNTSYWLSLQVGDDPELSPRLEMTGVCYSLQAAAADSAVKVANNSITTASLASSSVTSDKIVDEAVTGQKIAPNTINATHLVDAPGVSHSIRTLCYFDAGNIDYLVDSIEITIPAPGYVCIIATGYVAIHHAITVISWVDLGLERNRAIQSISQATIFIPVTIPTGTLSYPYSATRVMDETSAGTKKYYLFARYNSGGSPETNVTASFLSAMYFPTLRGTLN